MQTQSTTVATKPKSTIQWIKVHFTIIEQAYLVMHKTMPYKDYDIIDHVITMHSITKEEQALLEDNGLVVEYMHHVDVDKGQLFVDTTRSFEHNTIVLSMEDNGGLNYDVRFLSDVQVLHCDVPNRIVADQLHERYSDLCKDFQDYSGCNATEFVDGVLRVNMLAYWQDCEQAILDAFRFGSTKVSVIAHEE